MTASTRTSTPLIIVKDYRDRLGIILVKVLRLLLCEGVPSNHCDSQYAPGAVVVLFGR